MKFETYKRIVDYRRAVLTGDRKPLADLTNPQQKAFKRKAASFTLTDNTLYRKGKIVLHEMNTLPTLVHIDQEDLIYQGGYLELERSANRKYHTDNLRETGSCLFVCANCSECSIQRMFLVSDVPMPHLSIESRARVCRTLGLSLGRKPVSLNDHDTIDPISHEFVLMECALGGSCCFLNCIHFLTGNRVRSWALQREPRSNRKNRRAA